MIQVPGGLWHSSLSLIPANALNQEPYQGEPLPCRTARTTWAWVKEIGPDGSRLRKGLEHEAWLCPGCPVLGIRHPGPLSSGVLLSPRPQQGATQPGLLCLLLCS